MLTLYRRHGTACSGAFHLKDNPQEFTKCDCPIYAYESAGGKIIRRSMKTRDWGRATRDIRSDAPAVLQPNQKTIAEARDAYLADCRGRNLSPGTIYNYSNTIRYLCDFTGLTFPIANLSLEVLRDFRGQLTAKHRGARTKERETGRPLSARGGIKVDEAPAHVPRILRRQRLVR